MTLLRKYLGTFSPAPAIAQSSFTKFIKVVFKSIFFTFFLFLTDNYAFFLRWDNKTSVVIPDEDIFFFIAFLTSALPFSAGTDGLEQILMQNKRILNFCKVNGLGIKQYMPPLSYIGGGKLLQLGREKGIAIRFMSGQRWQDFHSKDLPSFSS